MQGTQLSVGGGRFRMFWKTAAACAVMTCAASSGLGQTTYRLIRVVENTIAEPLARPVGLTHALGDYSRVFVWQKGGKIRTINLTTNPLPTVGSSATPFHSVTVTGNADANDERGLLGLAMHPQYMTNGKFYVNYTISISGTLNTRVSEFTNTTPSSNIASVPAGEKVLLQFTQPQSNHNGGWMAFGPDGYLYISQGDGGGSGDGLDGASGHNTTCSPTCIGTGNGQLLTTLLGKVLRINVNGSGLVPEGGVVGGVAGGYTVPADNPFVGVAGAKDEIWAYGLRNAWRNSFDRQTGDLWIADVGQDTFEEINHQPAITAGNQTTVRGRNYGWRCYEGTATFSTAPNTTGCPSGFDAGGATGPLGMYAHGSVSTPPPRMFPTATMTGCTIIGGYVYRGCAIPALQGLYVFTDYCTGRIFTTSINGSTGILNTPTQLTELWIGPPPGTSIAPLYTRPTLALVSFGEDAYGELYVLDEVNNRIYKFVSLDADHIPLANTDASRNGVVSIDDLFIYINQWLATDNKADYDRNSTVSIDDLFKYINAWLRGPCPF